MKALLPSRIFSAISLLSLTLHGADSPPVLLSRPSPATHATPVPEITFLDAITDDGRQVLLTTSAERLATGDGNRFSDIILFDLQTGQATLVSRPPVSAPGAGPSIAVGMASDASRIAMLTRSRALATGATAAGWNLLARATDTGLWTPIALATPSNAPLGTALDAMLSANGRHVFFASADRTLAPGTLPVGRNVYRHDLVATETQAVSTALPASLGTPVSLTNFLPTPDGLGATLDLVVRISNVGRLEVAFRDLVTGTTLHASAKPPPALGASQLYHSAGVASPDRRWLTYRSESSIGVTRYHGLSLVDLSTGTTTLLNLRTNEPTRQTFPSNAHQARFDANGQFIVFAAPLPGDFTAAGGHTNGPNQIYLHDVSLGQTLLISVAPDGVTPANAEALNPEIAAHGRGAMFISAATNLVSGADTPISRLYWWDRSNATLQVVTVLDSTPTGGEPILSPGGSWIAWLTGSDSENPVVHVWNTLTGVATSRTLAPVTTESASGPGWIGIQPAGVSADGRFVAITATSGDPSALGAHAQVQRIDTQSGTVSTLSTGFDGQPANGRSIPPSISADASCVLFVSSATNLVSGDANRRPDVFAFDVSNNGRRMLRTDAIPATAAAHWDAMLSPAGSLAYVRFAETSTQIRARFADAVGGTLSAAIPGQIHSLPAFSRDGRRLAVSVGTTSSASTAAVQIHDPSSWLAAGSSIVPALWTSESSALEPALDADGSRVAFVLSTAVSATSNTLVIVDWAAHETVLSRPITRTLSASPRLSDDGRFAVWLAPADPSNSVNQVWLADVADGSVRPISIALDGVTPANGNCRNAEISSDGRYIAYASLADNLVPDDTNETKDVFLHDTVTRQTLLLSRTPVGRPANAWSHQPFFSANGRSLFFLSLASDLAPGDWNQAMDLFKIDILPGSGLFLVLRRNVLTGRTELVWNPSEGRRYAVESKDTMEGAWSRLPGSFTGQAPVELDPAEAPHRFFRVVELP